MKKFFILFLLIGCQTRVEDSESSSPKATEEEKKEGSYFFQLQEKQPESYTEVQEQEADNYKKLNEVATQQVGEIATIDLSSNVVGLKNIGNTCYFNAALQMLVAIDSFSQFCLQKRLPLAQDPFGSDDGRSFVDVYCPFVKAYSSKQHAEAMTPQGLVDLRASLSSLQTFNAATFADEPKFPNGAQADADELLGEFLRLFHEGFDLDKSFYHQKTLSDEEKNNYFLWRNYSYSFKTDVAETEFSIRSKLVDLVTRSTLFCPTAEGKTYESYEYQLLSRINLLPPDGKKTIQELLQDFQTTETLSPENLYTGCPGGVTTDQKKLEIFKLPGDEIPGYLILTLKRFERDQTLQISRKTTKELLFEEKLTFKAAGEKQERKYELVATVNHYGSFLGGHYVSYVARKDNSGQKRWFLADDERIVAVPIDKVLEEKKSVYMLLFKERRD